MSLLLVLTFLGCDRAIDAPSPPPSPAEQMPAGDWSKVPLADGAIAAAHAGTAVPPVFRNGEEKVACPVMGAAMAAPDEAVSYADHAGKRYYFCCDSCEKMFLEDPDAYADGLYLREHGLDPAACADADAAN